MTARRHGHAFPNSTRKVITSLAEGKIGFFLYFSQRGRHCSFGLSGTTCSSFQFSATQTCKLSIRPFVNAFAIELPRRAALAASRLAIGGRDLVGRLLARGSRGRRCFEFAIGGAMGDFARVLQLRVILDALHAASLCWRLSRRCRELSHCSMGACDSSVVERGTLTFSPRSPGCSPKLKRARYAGASGF